MSLLATCFLLAGCVGNALESPKAASVNYVLKAAAPEIPITLNRPVIIKVIQPTIAEGLDTDGIAVVENGRRMRYLKSAHWTGSLGDVIKRFAIDSLNNVGDVTALGEEDYSLKPDYQLVINLSAFQAEYEATAGQGFPTGHVKVQLILSDYKNNEIKHNIRMTRHSEIAENSATAIADSHEKVLQQAFSELIFQLTQ